MFLKGRGKDIIDLEWERPTRGGYFYVLLLLLLLLSLSHGDVKGEADGRPGDSCNANMTRCAHRPLPISIAILTPASHL